MKQHHQLTIAGQSYRLISRDIRRSLNTPARASFTVAGKVPETGMVTYGFGFSGGAGQIDYRPWFLGYMEKVTLDAQHSTLFCRDLAAALIHDLPLSLRNVTMVEVLAAITQQTGLPFMLPDAPYTQHKAAHFCSLGSGLLALHSMGNVFKIPQCQWQQLTNGKIYLGAAQHAPWHNKKVSLPTHLFSQQQANQSARIAPMPAIRPGISINGKPIQGVILQEDMIIKWAQ